jgi:predicted secreted Zn-dependent protease
VTRYSLSCLTALNEMKKIDNPRVMKMMNLIHRENEHLSLMWAKGHAGIQGNEKTDQHAIAALISEIHQTHKTAPDDCKKKRIRMSIIGKLDGDIETKNKKKQQLTNTHEERTGDSVATENWILTPHSRTPGGSRATA